MRTDTDQPLLSVRKLTVTLPGVGRRIEAVRNVSFDIRRGEVLSLVGESGCGKSMTAYALLRLLPRSAVCSAESIILDGLDLMSMPESRLADLRGNRISLIAQDPMTALNPAFTIGNQLVETMRRHRRVPREVARRRAVDLMTQVGIANAERRLAQFPHELSGGLRQRIVIAMALMCEPDLIIADEPTTALDATVQAQILEMLMELKRDRGFSLLLITHDMGVVASVADRVAVMYAGEVVETGILSQVLATPAHPYTRGLMRSIPRLGRGHHQPLRSIRGVVQPVFAGAVGCAFRSRCDMAIAACGTTSFELRSGASDHPYRCRVSAAPEAMEARQ